ncbi:MULTISPECIES: hypothetical protein [Lactobacillus]|nr:MULTISPECIES: hypothetical protein [Lactobacillus]MCX8720827.1 hypothetical protein [Lactobacillus sp. B4010]MCX8732554.1 hypothetical protein [Lactobacillus sp. B4015]MCX8734774.1 hypothetical protein [Lactobacillus sp. B4012]QYN56828.1 hypothetical protein GYM69_06695 [Lactobacillus panisapium]
MESRNQKKEKRFEQLLVTNALIPIAISVHEIRILTEPELKEPTFFAKV